MAELLPFRLMLGNGISYSLHIKLNLVKDCNNLYILSMLDIQPKILEFLESLPIWTGLGIKQNVQEIEFIFSLVSREDISLAEYLDLTNLALLAGYEFWAKSMTAMAVQVIGTWMNKFVGQEKISGEWF